jgi:tRNA G10  N-methylase Trm11
MKVTYSHGGINTRVIIFDRHAYNTTRTNPKKERKKRKATKRRFFRPITIPLELAAASAAQL